MGERFERAFADWLGVDDAVVVSSGTTALHLGVRALGWGQGDEVVTSPFSFVASANCLLYEGARPVFATSTRRRSTSTRRRRRRRLASGPRGSCRSTSSATRRRCRSWRRWRPSTASASSRTPARRSARSTPRARKVGARGNLATFAFYANKQMTTGEGGMIVPCDPERAARLRSERNQGRAADMGWLDHGGLGFNYRLSDVAAALGVAQVEKLDWLLGGRAAVAEMYARGLAGIEGCGADRRPRPGAAQLVRLLVRLPDGVDRDATIRRLGERGVASKAYLPCIHLFPHLRELGYSEGQFPVAEAASARLAGAAVLPGNERGRGGRGSARSSPRRSARAPKG